MTKVVPLWPPGPPSQEILSLHCVSLYWPCSFLSDLMTHQDDIIITMMSSAPRQPDMKKKQSLGQSIDFYPSFQINRCLSL